MRPPCRARGVLERQSGRGPQPQPAPGPARGGARGRPGTGAHRRCRWPLAHRGRGGGAPSVVTRQREQIERIVRPATATPRCPRVPIKDSRSPVAPQIWPSLILIGMLRSRGFSSSSSIVVVILLLLLRRRRHRHPPRRRHHLHGRDPRSPTSKALVHWCVHASDHLCVHA